MDKERKALTLEIVVADQPFEPSAAPNSPLPDRKGFSESLGSPDWHHVDIPAAKLKATRRISRCRPDCRAKKATDQGRTGAHGRVPRQSRTESSGAGAGHVENSTREQVNIKISFEGR